MTGFEEHPTYSGYFVSREGQIIGPSGRTLRLRASGQYLSVRVRGMGKLIHRMVLETFSGPSNGRVGMHLNNNPKDNRLDNLKWGTQKENVAQAAAMGNMARFGSRNGRSKLSEEQVLCLRADRASGISWGKLASKYGISKFVVGQIVRGLLWKSIQENSMGDTEV